MQYNSNNVNNDTVKIQISLNKKQVKLCLDIVNFCNGWDPDNPNNQEKDKLNKAANEYPQDSIMALCAGLLKNLTPKEESGNIGAGATEKINEKTEQQEKEKQLNETINNNIIGYLTRGEESITNSMLKGAKEHQEAVLINYNTLLETGLDDTDKLRKDVIKLYFTKSSGSKTYKDLSALLGYNKEKLKEIQQSLKGNNNQ